MPTVLVFLPEGFEEIETVAPIDLLRRAGAEVTIAALGEQRLVTGRTGIAVQADTTLAAVPADAVFDLIFLPGGPGVKHLRADARVSAWVRRQAARGGWLAAICAAPTVLHDAGLLVGKNHTAHFSVAEELPARLAGLRVVCADKLITSRGAGTSIEFGLTLVEKLFSPAKASEIATAIMA